MHGDFAHVETRAHAEADSAVAREVRGRLADALAKMSQAPPPAGTPQQWAWSAQMRAMWERICEIDGGRA